MRWLRALRALARVEQRQLLRHPARSLLVVLLVAVPVAALVGGSALHLTTQPSLDERRAAVVGSAALRVHLDAEHGLERALHELPAGIRIEHVFNGQESVRVPGRRLAGRFFGFAPTAHPPGGDAAGALTLDGLARGLLEQTAGRLPASTSEVCLSDVLLDNLGLGVGGRVTLAAPDGAGTVEATITGVVVDPETTDMPVVLRYADLEQPYGAHSLLVDLPERDAPVAAGRLRAAGFRVIERTAIEHDPFEAIALFVVGGFGFFEAALVVAAAFAVSLRRRQREIGLLGATGAPRPGIQWALVVSAGLLAVVGVVLGGAAGVGSAAALHPYLDGWNGRSNGELELSVQHIVGGAVLGILTACVAAALPARTAARLPIRVALSGRRPVTTGSGRWALVGLALLLVGLALMVWGGRHAATIGASGLLAGSIVAVLGLGASTPWILEHLARCAGPLPTKWRLAVRDAGRFRSRNGPVVTAVLAGTSISVLMASVFASVEPLVQGATAGLRDDQLVVEGPGAEEIAQRLGDELAAVSVAPLLGVYSNGELVRVRAPRDVEQPRLRRGWLATGGRDLLRAVGAEGEAAPEAQSVVALRLPSELGHLPGSIDLVAGDDRVVASLALTEVAWGQELRDPAFVVASESLARLGLSSGPPPRHLLIPWVVRLGEAVTQQHLEQARIVASSSAGTSVDAGLLHVRPARVFVRVVLAICALTGLVVIFIATSLSSVESAEDARVLHTVGAAPRVLYGHAAARAGYLAFLGCVLAVPAGLLPLFGLFGMTRVSVDFVMPWSLIAIAVLGMPAIAYGGTWLFTALRGVRVHAVTSAS